MSTNSNTFVTKVRQFASRSPYFLISLVLLSASPLCSWAQDNYSLISTLQQQELTPEQKNKTNPLIKIVRKSTERFKDVAVSQTEGYVFQFGCVSGPDSGAMELHYRFGLPAFYSLRVWAWKENPNGSFVNWPPSVSCELFGGRTS